MRGTLGKVRGAQVRQSPSSSAGAEQVEVRVGTAADLRALRATVGALVTAHGAAADVREEIVLAVQEAVKNGLAACHGCGEHVVVSLRCGAQAFRVEVRDPGCGFDLTAQERRSFDPTAEHGRGLLLMRRLMDTLTVRRDGCCTVVMTRRFAPRRGA